MITAIILAAGESKRMGEPKMLMPYGKSTVLQTVISTIQSAGIKDILVVTGGARQQVVHDPDKAALLDKASADIGADETSPAGYQILFHPNPRDLRFTIYSLTSRHNWSTPAAWQEAQQR